MNSRTVFLLVVVAALSAPEVSAHGGHGATPVHLHPGNDVAVDVGAALLALGAGAVLLAAARRRAG